MDVDALKKACKGVVASRGEANFSELIHGNLWNRLIHDRSPQVVVRAKDEEDVIAAIRFAKDNALKVVVRGGGHNWCQPTLRNGGMLIDLSELNRIISIDVAARKAVMQPVVTNREIQKTLNEKGLAYPTGHCPQVKLSGYLLDGGMSWNQGSWGAGTESAEAIELVTAEGKLITASKDENQEYFWAARGSGSGFFGVVTRYRLKLYPLPKTILRSTYFYSMNDAAAVAAWLGDKAAQISPAVELSIFLMEAPADLKDKTAGQGGKVAMLTATAFTDSDAESTALLQPLEDCPLLSQCLSRSFATPLVFEQMFDLSGAIWPEVLRNRVEATFSNSSPGEIVEAVARHVTKCPVSDHRRLVRDLHGPERTGASPGYGLFDELEGLWRAVDDVAVRAVHCALKAVQHRLLRGRIRHRRKAVERGRIHVSGELETPRRPARQI